MSGVRTDASGNVILTANGVDAVTAKTTGVITAGAQGVSGLDCATVGQSTGVGQTWQVFTGLRALGTPYTNNTGKQIYVHVAGTAGVSTYYNIKVNGVDLLGGQSGAAGLLITTGVVPIPIGATYTVTLASGASTALYWSELRT